MCSLMSFALHSLQASVFYCYLFLFALCKREVLMSIKEIRYIFNSCRNFLLILRCVRKGTWNFFKNIDISHKPYGGKVWESRLAQSVPNVLLKSHHVLYQLNYLHPTSYTLLDIKFIHINNLISITWFLKSFQLTK